MHYDPMFDLDNNGELSDDELEIERETLLLDEYDDDEDVSGGRSVSTTNTTRPYQPNRSSSSHELRNLSTIEALICVFGGLIGTAAIMALLGLNDMPVILIVICWLGISGCLAWLMMKTG